MASDERAVASWLLRADRSKDWSGVTATVLGLGQSGFAAADALLRVGAVVTVIDQQQDETRRDRAEVLDTLGATVLLEQDQLPKDFSDLVVPSPGLPPTHPWLIESASATIWSGETLAWQLRPTGTPAPWLVLTGTNGKTTTVEMLAAILQAEGHHTLAVGNVGRPVVEAVFAEPAYDVLPVELSSFQLHWTSLVRPHSAALLNIAEDHSDWHSGHDGYVADKARVFHDAQSAVIYNKQDPLTETLAREADVSEDCRGIGFTLGAPSVGMVGVVDGVLVDRAFIESRQTHAAELVAIDALKVSGSHNVANAAAAATLARSFGASTSSVRRGLTGFQPQDHRLQFIATQGGVDYVDDSKATNTHAADVALASFDRVVWIAGGLAKGGRFDDLVARHGHRLVGVVLMGTDRDLIHEAVRRHAPHVPVIEVQGGETDPMESAVNRAAKLAPEGSTVLLSPGCASMDQFTDYAARGAAFVAAVRRLSL